MPALGFGSSVARSGDHVRPAVVRPGLGNQLAVRVRHRICNRRRVHEDGRLDGCQTSWPSFSGGAGLPGAARIAWYRSMCTRQPSPQCSSPRAWSPSASCTGFVVIGPRMPSAGVAARPRASVVADVRDQAPPRARARTHLVEQPQRARSRAGTAPGSSSDSASRGAARRWRLRPARTTAVIAAGHQMPTSGLPSPCRRTRRRPGRHETRQWSMHARMETAPGCRRTPGRRSSVEQGDSPAPRRLPCPPHSTPPHPISGSDACGVVTPACPAVNPTVPAYHNCVFASPVRASCSPSARHIPCESSGERRPHYGRARS